MRTLTRRRFLELAGAALWRPQRSARPVRFGVIADVHHGLASRTEARLEDFLAEAARRELDFIVQLGDFNHPVAEASGFLKLWHGYKGKRFGVLGNHDMDLGSKRQALDLWELKDRFYAFDAGFLRFLVLDANHMRLDGKLIPYDNGNWYRGGITTSWVDEEQLDWLREELARSPGPVAILCHQELDEALGGGGVPNRAEVRRVFRESGKVEACLTGHSHLDVDETREGVYFLRVNSASYAWVGEKYGRMAHYDRSLYAFVEIWPDGRMEIEGRRGLFEGESPFSRGVPNPERYSASIRSREVMASLL
jgi:3',5'-cyclic AMP phosphodiesterase CpdA